MRGNHGSAFPSIPPPPPPPLSLWCLGVRMGYPPPAPGKTLPEAQWLLQLWVQTAPKEDFPCGHTRHPGTFLAVTSQLD